MVEIFKRKITGEFQKSYGQNLRRIRAFFAKKIENLSKRRFCQHGRQPEEVNDAVIEMFMLQFNEGDKRYSFWMVK